MGRSGRPEAVILTGVFGVGKSTVAADIADVLDALEVPYAALDLDWLAWSNAGGSGRDAEHRLLVENLASVAANYRRAGAIYFVVARTIHDVHELDDISAALGVPARVVEVTVPFAEIARRLAVDPTEARQRDLETSRRWTEAGRPARLGGFTVHNDRTVRELTLELLGRLGWPRPIDAG